MSNKPPFPWNWESMRSWFEVPFPTGNGSSPQPDRSASWLEQMASDVLGRMPPAGRDPADRPEYDLFDLGRELLIRVRVPQETDPYGLAVLVGRQSLVVRGLAEPLRIALPEAVRKDQTRAFLKRGVLHIRMRKRLQAESLTDIPIRVLGN